MSQNVSSAAVVIGASRVNIPNMGHGHVFIFAQIKHLNLHLELKLLGS